MTSPTRDIVARLRDRIGQYFDLGYSEGASGRNTDTMAGDAQAAWYEIDALISSLVAERDAAQTSHAAARQNFLTMQGAADALLKRAEKAEAERDELHAWFDGLTPNEMDGVITRFKDRALTAERLLAEAREALTRIAAIKYPTADTHYALKATIDYARDQARATLSIGGGNGR